MFETNKIEFINSIIIINVMASSIDGKIALHSKESSKERKSFGLINDADFKHMQKLVAECDAVFIGARSIESEDGAFRVSHLRSSGDEPHWIVFTRSGDLSFSSPFWKQKGFKKSLFFVSSFDISKNPQLSSHVTESGLHQYLGNISGLLHELSLSGVKKVALLGGGTLNGAFWEQKLVNKLFLTLSPLLVGGQNTQILVSTPHFICQKLKLCDISNDGDFLFLEYSTLR